MFGSPEVYQAHTLNPGSCHLLEELDSEYLIIWDGFDGKPWAYRDASGAPLLQLRVVET